MKPAESVHDESQRKQRTLRTNVPKVRCFLFSLSPAPSFT
jgi:hypothetical protein